MQWFKLENDELINLEHVTRFRYGPPDLDYALLIEDAEANNRDVATVYLVDGSQVEVGGHKMEVLANFLYGRSIDDSLQAKA